MFSTDFIFRQQENLVDNQKCWAGFRPLCNKILFSIWPWVMFSSQAKQRGWKDQGGIEQLRGPNYIQFWPPYPSSEQTWTFYIVSHTPYS